MSKIIVRNKTDLHDARAEDLVRSYLVGCGNTTNSVYLDAKEYHLERFGEITLSGDVFSICVVTEQ